jgi:PAS domain S-box-containing protein
VSYIVLLYSHEQEIHKRLAEIVESSSDAIIGKTLEGIITDWNKGAEHLYGYSADEVIGKSISLLLPPDRADELRVLLEKIRQGESIERYETERMTKIKGRIWVSLSISPIRNDWGTIIGASVITHNITERKLAQDALERANKKLQLFSSITRHDVLNQLTVLNIYHKLTESMIDDPVALSFLDKAKKAADAISEQIQFTHEYQEIGVKKPTWQDVYTSFINAAAMFKEKSVAILPCKKGLEIYADPLLEEVFYKLIDNSIIYGAVVSEIRCTCHEDESGMTLVCEDNGVGVPDEDKLKIFERVAGENTRLGLFLIREILSITNITIIENGEPGKGARFEIHIPKGTYRFTGSGKTPKKW